MTIGTSPENRRTYTDESVHGNNVVVGMSEVGTFNANLDIPMRQDSFSKAIPHFGNFTPDAGATLGFAILSDIEAYFFMNAAQGDARSNVLQAPKITIFNGQYGNIYDGSETPFVTSVNPVVADFSAAYQPVIVVLSEGTNLTVQAIVTHDRQYVKMVLNPVFSKITNKSNTFRFSGEDTTEDSGTEKTKGDSENPAASDERDTTRTSTTSRSGVTIQQPVIARVSVSTTVSVPDGGTILLGGVKRLSEGRTENGVPILNKIPFVNRLFMNTAIGRDTQSIMLMVTPRILIQEEEEEYMLGSMQPTYN
jgi:general secretion pathway protein D